LLQILQKKKCETWMLRRKGYHGRAYGVAVFKNLIEKKNRAWKKPWRFGNCERGGEDVQSKERL